MFESIIKNKRPCESQGWRRFRISLPELEKRGYPYELWVHAAHRLKVISAVEAVSEAGQVGPEYHLSISGMGTRPEDGPQRCTAADALWVLTQFDMVDASEDNHVPHGRVRNFWRPVAEHLIGHLCPCVDEEPAMREDKGDYIWRGVRNG